MKVGDYVFATDTTPPQVNFHRVTAIAALDTAHPYAIRSATLSPVASELLSDIVARARLRGDRPTVAQRLTHA